MTIDAEFIDRLEEAVDGGDDRALVDTLPDRADSLTVHRVPDRDHEVTLDLERYLDGPRRPRGSSTLHDPVDFASYVNRLRTPRTTVWADQDATRVTAVLNDAEEITGDTDGLDGGRAYGWRDHTAVLELQVDPEWAAWLALDGQLKDQETIAEHFEAYAGNVVRPDAATMLEVASSLHGTTTANFESTKRDRTGDITIKYTEQTGVKAGEHDEIEVPERFTVRIAPYVGFEPVELEAMFRIRTQRGNLAIGYRLVRPDLVLRAAFDRVRTTIVDHLTAADSDGTVTTAPVPVYLGAAPAAITTSVAGAGSRG